MFSTLSKTEILILATLNLSSANALNLDQFKILLFGKDDILHQASHYGILGPDSPCLTAD